MKYKQEYLKLKKELAEEKKKDKDMKVIGIQKKIRLHLKKKKFLN
tara:strand:- start:91 stop:225 length:135 start_codon:yes stop_codon:yes gene_type:complete